MMFSMFVLLHSALAQDSVTQANAPQAAIQVHALVYREVPVVNLSYSLPGYASEGGTNKVVRVQDCVVDGDRPEIAILVTGGEPPSRKYGNLRKQWRDVWGQGRVALVLVGPDVKGTYSGHCDIAPVGGAPGNYFNWTVEVSSAPFPERTLPDPSSLLQSYLGAVTTFIAKVPGWRERGSREGEIGALDYAVDSAWMAWQYVDIEPSSLFRFAS